MEKLFKTVYANDGPSTPNWTNRTGDNPATLKDLEVVFYKIVSFAVELAVVVFFVMIIYGGFKYLTSGGDAKATESAQKTLTYAVLGIVLLIGIWLILRFVYIFTGVNVTVFTIPSPGQ